MNCVRDLRAGNLNCFLGKMICASRVAKTPVPRDALCYTSAERIYRNIVALTNAEYKWHVQQFGSQPGEDWNALEYRQVAFVT